jgi:DNA-binding transcriptional MerR regulator
LEKAPEAFRTISEVAQDLDLPQHVLRFWESRFAQIKPLKRGGGRRYYRPEDVDLLRGIRHLLYGEGYTIRGVQRILKDQGVRYVQTIWREAGTPDGARAETIDGKSQEDEPEPPERASFRDVSGSADTRTVPPRPAAPRSPISLPLDDVSSEEKAGQEARWNYPTSPGRQGGVSAPMLSRQGAGLRQEDIEKLKGILHELDECRRLLDSALTGG